MKIYLAGGISGNLFPFWKLYLTGTENKKFLFDTMKLYLAGTESRSYLLDKENERINEIEYLNNINILESFYYLMKNPQMIKMVNKFGGFLLDSGAFTFIQGNHKEKIDWENYLEQYAEFINKYDIKLFFELDIDSIVGLKEVERLRDKLEYLTKKKSIPVWHKNRGKDYFIWMCKNYPYVALGGIAIKEIPLNIFETSFPWFIRIAHENGAKIHGLGYTGITKLKQYHFDSVDSTAWLYGNRSGYIYKFNPQTGLMDKIEKKGFRLKHKESAFNNFNEWVKFSKYAEENL